VKHALVRTVAVAAKKIVSRLFRAAYFLNIPFNEMQKQNYGARYSNLNG
jgi:hypothetical protein